MIWIREDLDESTDVEEANHLDALWTVISDKSVKGRKEKFQLMVAIYFDNKTPDGFEEGQYAVIA